MVSQTADHRLGYWSYSGEWIHNKKYKSKINTVIIGKSFEWEYHPTTNANGNKVFLHIITTDGWRCSFETGAAPVLGLDDDPPFAPGAVVMRSARGKQEIFENDICLLELLVFQR